MVHLLVVLMLINTTKFFPGLKGAIIPTAADLIKNQQLTYLDLPPDLGPGAWRVLSADEQAAIFS